MPFGLRLEGSLVMAKTVNLGVIGERLKAVGGRLETEPFSAAAEMVDHQIILRGEVERAGRREAHSEVTPITQLFTLDRDALSEALTRLERWAAGTGVQPAA